MYIRMYIGHIIIVTPQLFVFLDTQNDTDYSSCATVTVVEGEDSNDTCIGEPRHCHTDTTQYKSLQFIMHSHMHTHANKSTINSPPYFIMVCRSCGEHRNVHW